VCGCVQRSDAETKLCETDQKPVIYRLCVWLCAAIGCWDEINMSQV